MKDKINSTIFARDSAEGNDVDHSANPIYGHEVVEVVRAFSLANTFESALRKFALFSTWAAVGRSSAISARGVCTEKGRRGGVRP